MIFTCNCNINIDTFNHSYWESKKTTSDEIEIIKFLLNNQKNLKSKNILHIGIGNSYLAEKLSFYNCKIDGITISKKEFDLAINKKIKNYKVFLINKFSKDFINFNRNKKYDFIIDNNLKSYSCCNQSFEFFFNILNNLIYKKSLILTSRKGMKWSKLLKRSLSFNLKNFFYIKLKEYNGPKRNILTINSGQILAKKFKLIFYFNNKIAYFKKK